MPKIIQFNSLGGPEVLEFKDIVLSKELGSIIFHFGLLSGETIKVDISRHVRKDSYLLPYSMFNYVDKDDALFRGIDYISKKIIEGIFKPKIDKVFSFKSTIEAYKYLLKYDVMGKIVVEIDLK